MDPFIHKVQIGGLHITDPLPIHTNGDLHFCYRGRFGNLSVVLKECHQDSVKEGEFQTIQHPNLLMNFGRTPCNGFEILEGYYCNLVEFLQRIKLHQSSKPFASNFLSQILNGLQGLHKRNFAHGNLIPENVVILFDPPLDPHAESSTSFVDKVNNPKTSFIVKLKDYEMIREGTTEDFLKDFTLFGQIVNLFYDESELSHEASDLICRIQGTWDSIDRVSAQQGQQLSNLFKRTYLLAPTDIQDHPDFWLDLKRLEFFSLMDEFVTFYYEDNAHPKDSVKQFVKALKSLDVEKNWTENLHQTIKDVATRKVKGKAEEATPVGVLKVIRNVHTHYIKYMKTAKDEIGRKDCYHYFSVKYPELLIHTYRCLELHYPKMRSQNAIDAGCDEAFRPYIPSVIDAVQQNE